ncbi:MAG: DUF5615 family PIN-like protein [bacterium]|jgi:predicted nuclease of predicted toxin-antitoxin system
MKLLADENIENATVRWLRSEKHDVIWVAEDLVSTKDPLLLDMARESARIISTRDLDFGELIYRNHLCTSGIILLRLVAANQDERLILLQKGWKDIEMAASGNFVVVKMIS